jgi:hypothetical protein
MLDCFTHILPFLHIWCIPHALSKFSGICCVSKYTSRILKFWLQGTCCLQYQMFHCFLVFIAANDFVCLQQFFSNFKNGTLGRT